jgi:predicted amidophosphoribosyltransferase
MQCIRCGKEMVNTMGGNYHCPSCGFAVNDLMYRPSNCDIPMPQGFGKQEGWICPVCGRGVAPWVDMCPCQGSEMQIAYGTSTTTDNDELHRLFELNDKRVEEMISFQEKYGG